MSAPASCGPCLSCGQALETPLVCTSCGNLFSTEPAPGPFETLGLPVSYTLDTKALKKRLLQFSRHVHPDFFGTADAQVQATAERNSAQLNDAFEILSDDFRRADWIVKQLKGPSESDERQMPQAFLMEVLEWNELLEEARADGPDSRAWKALDTLDTDLCAERETTLAAVAAGLDPLPAEGAESLARTRRQLNAIRYLDRSLAQIRTMRLGAAAH
ncbi:MAG: molecular chaperone HscB [Chlamydiales bacterium]|jgi:molecular chaperone HscB